MVTSFKDSQEAAFRRLVRDAIRKGDFTKGERDVIIALVNHWFHHKGKNKGIVHPGRAKLAKKAGVSVRTVASTLAMLRAAGAISVVEYPNGGRNASRYSINIRPLMTLCGCDWVDDFLRGAADNCTVYAAKIAQFPGSELHGYPVQKLHTVYNTLNLPLSFSKIEGSDV